MSDVSRREFLESATLAATVAGAVGGVAAVAAPKQEYGGHERSSEELPTFKFSLEESRGGHKKDGPGA